MEDSQDVSWGQRNQELRSCAELRRQMEHSHGGRRPGTKADLGWARWLPIRQLTDEEWEIYQERKREQFQQRCSSCPPSSAFSLHRWFTCS